MGIKVVVLRASRNTALKIGQSYPFLCEIYFNCELLEALLPGTAVRGVLAPEPSVLQKCLWTCNAFLRGPESIARCIAEEITSQQKCADYGKEANRTERGRISSVFPFVLL